MRRKTRIGPSWPVGLLVLLALLLAACSSPAPNFNISLSPTSLTVQQGSSGSTTLTLTPQNGFTGTVTLALVDASTGNPVPGINLTPTSLNVTGSTPITPTLTVNVAGSVPTGSYSLKVRAVSGSLNKEASLSLDVTAGGGSPDFTIALSPTSLTVQQGASGNTTLTLTPQNGFTGTVTLALVDASTGNPVPGINLTPTSLNVTGSTPITPTLTVNVAGSVPTGNYSLKVRAVSGSLDKEANLSLTVNSLLGSTWTQLGSELNISSGQDAESPSLALDASGNPVVAWQENVPGQFGNIYVKRLNGTTWVQLGNELDINPSQNAVKPSLALDTSGNPVVAWTEWNGSSNDVYVKRWDSVSLSWVQLGGALDVNPAQNAISHSLALDSANRPVVAFFENDGTSFNIYVKRWDGTDWVLLGGALDVNLGEDAYDPSLALDASGNPVVAWHEHTPGQFDNIYVKRWNGTSWEPLGGALDVNVNDGAALASLALDASGNPVVAWTEWNALSNNVYVKRWDGANWVPLGNELDISEPQPAGSPSLALDTSGRPVVAWFENDGTSDNIYVKRWDGTSWLLQGNGLDTVLSQVAQYPKVAMDSLGYPVVVWEEQVGSVKRIYVKRRLP